MAASSSQPRKVTKTNLEAIVGSRAKLVKFNESFASRSVETSKYLFIPDFERYHFKFHTLLAEIGLSKILIIKERFTPNIIRAFYSNLTYSNGRIMSEVRGIPIDFDEEQLCVILGIPYCSFPKFTDSIHSFSVLNDYDRGDDYRLITGATEVPSKIQLKVGMLSLENRLLLHSIAHCLLNKSGNISEANAAELHIMARAHRNHPFNYAHLVMKRMEAHASKGPLPYGSLIVKILKHFKISPIEGKEISNPVEINEHSLSRMGYAPYQPHEGLPVEWVRKRLPRERHPDPMSSSEEEDEPPAQSSTSTSSLLSMENMMREFMTEFRGRFDTIQTAVGSLQTAVDNNTRTLQRLVQHFPILDEGDGSDDDGGDGAETGDS